MKICAIFNIPSLYREPIYTLMDKSFDVDFIIGDANKNNITQFNPDKLTNYKGALKNIYKGDKLIWQRKAIRKAFSKRYTHYVITGNTGIRSNWIIILIAKLLGRKTTLWTHGLYGNEKGLTKFKNKLYLRFASDLLVYTERGAEILIKEGFNSKKITTIYNSLDYEQQYIYLKQKSDNSFIRNYFGTDYPTICFIGRLTSRKRIDILIEATSLAKHNNTPYNLIIVGDGLERNNLEELTTKLDLVDNVWFYGACYDEQMLANIISNCILSVSPGNCGLNAIHSLTYGTPLISHSNLYEQMPEVEAIIELEQRTKQKFLFKQHSIEDLTKTIENIISLEMTNISTISKEIIADKWTPQNQLKIFGTHFDLFR